MKLYIIPFICKYRGQYEIQASSVDMAISIAYDSPLPNNLEYIDDSFEVCEDEIEDLMDYGNLLMVNHQYSILV